jgi:peptide deformylase
MGSIARDSFKEVYLRFVSPSGRHFPIYPGESAWIDYSYTVGDDKWWQWFQRAVRWPTRQLEVEMVFPAELEPVVWGTETSLSIDASPLLTPIRQERVPDEWIFRWSTLDPPLSARYRFEWRFQGGRSMASLAEMRPSDGMQAIGIRQDGDPMLHEVCRPFDLPIDADEARSVIDRLADSAGQATKLHRFTKGIGLAAPQIGITRAVAIVWFPDQEPFVLLNPRVVSQSDEEDEKYEGCLSFFDVRGMVPRPLNLEVEISSLDGTKRILTLQRGMARLVGHELDHLHGVLYTARMRTGEKPIPLSEYRGTGTAWQY